MQYAEDGYLPEALVNYLARLGWSHGDEEMFSARAVRRVVRPRAHQPVAGAVQPREAALWLNQQYLKKRRRRRGSRRWSRRASSATAAISRAGRRSDRVVALLKERARRRCTSSPTRRDDVLRRCASRRRNCSRAHVTTEVETPRSRSSRRGSQAVRAWAERGDQRRRSRVRCKAHGLKMPKLAMPLRVVVFGETQTPVARTRRWRRARASVGACWSATPAATPRLKRRRIGAVSFTRSLIRRYNSRRSVVGV